MRRSVAFLPYLRAFDAVARLGSVRAAADELALSPGAVSLQLRRLAETTGLVLFERAGRGLALTFAGREFARAVARGLGELEDAVGASRTVAPPRALTVALPPALGMAWLSAAVIEHAQDRGVTRLAIRSCVRAAEVDWSVVDMAVVYDNPPFADLWWTPMSGVRLRAVCSPVLYPQLARAARERRLDGLTLLHEDEGGEWRRWSRAAGIGLDGAGDAFLPSVGQAVSGALAGRGLALVSDVFVGRDLAAGRLLQPFAATIPASQAYYFVAPPQAADDEALAALRRDVLARLPKRGGRILEEVKLSPT